MISDLQKEAGKRVRAMREQRGWSRSELAQLTGSNEKAVSRDERGLSLGISRLLRYANIFNCGADRFIEQAANFTMKRPSARRNRK